MTTDLKEITHRSKELLDESKLMQIVKSANILIDLFGFEKAFKRIKSKHVGKQIEMHFPALNGSIKFTIVNTREQFKCLYEKPLAPTSTIILNVKRDKILKLISDILVLKDNLFGLMRLVPKLLTRKLKIKGKLIPAIILCRCMMIGKHEMYKGQL